MLSLKRCRELVGNEYRLSDSELQRLTERLYEIAHVAVENFKPCPANRKHRHDQTKQKRAKTSRPHSGSGSQGDYATLLALLSDDERYEIEERAAILEFDSGYSREKAEEYALREFRKHKSTKR